MTKHLLLRIARIQQIDIFFTNKGFSRNYIFNRIIYPHWFISKKTYYNYMGINAKHKLKKKYDLDWQEELEKYAPLDYIQLMKDLEEKDTFKPTETLFNTEDYHQMLRDGGKH